MGPARSASQALFYCVVLASGGAVFAAVGLFVSSIVEGTSYTAPLISAGVVLLCGNAPKSLDSLNPIAFMTGKAYLSASNEFVGPWPWGHLAAYVGIAAVFIWASVKAMERRDLLNQIRLFLLILLGFFAAGLQAQPLTSQPVFEVASVKANHSIGEAAGIRASKGSLTIANAPLLKIVAAAFGISEDRESTGSMDLAGFGPSGTISWRSSRGKRAPIRCDLCCKRC